MGGRSHQPQQLLADGEVAMTSAYSGWLLNAVGKEHKPLEIVRDDQVRDYGAFIIPKGSPARDQAIEYIRLRLRRSSWRI